MATDKKAGKASDRLPPKPINPGCIQSVLITWCSSTGKLRSGYIDLTKTPGFWWDSDNMGPGGSSQARPVPIIGNPSDLTGCNCVKMRPNQPGCCWWDAGTNAWVCPDEPA